MTDLVERLRHISGVMASARTKNIPMSVWEDDPAHLDEAATALEAKEKELAALRGLRDMLILCGELGGMQPGESAVAYLRRLIDGLIDAERDRDEAREAQYLLDWFSKHPKLELSFGGWDEDHDAEWSVHSVGGSRNDREWTLLANRSTPLEAIRAARAITGKKSTNG